MRQLLLLFALFAACCTAELTFNSYDPEYGVYVGKFSSPEFNEVTGLLYAINSSALQIINFTWSGLARDTFFWLDPSEKATRDGIRVPTFEYGLSPIGRYAGDTPRVVLLLPNERKISSFKSLSLFSLQDDVSYGSVPIGDNVVAPKSQMLQELKGDRFKIFGLVQVLDTRTIKIIGFSFEGNKAPDGYFFVGQGSNVTKENGAKAMIRGRDSPELILPMNERYTGGKDVFIQLPENYDIQHIDFLSIYSVKYDISYASIMLKNVSRYSIPPYVPPRKSYESMLIANNREWTWNLSNLLGTPTQTNFTFQLGPSGGRRGYQALHRVAKPPFYVWYVNGYLANLYLKRGVTYTFIVEGGRNTSQPEFNNPLYLTNDSYGGYSKLTKAEQTNVKIYAPENPPTNAAGRLCRWTANKHADRHSSALASSDSQSDEFESFADFQATLKLSCEDGDSPAVFYFTPTNATPNTLFFESYNNYQMGSTIFVVDEFPADLKHIVEEPYAYDARQHQANLELTRENGAASSRLLSLTGILLLCSSFIAALILL